MSANTLYQLQLFQIVKAYVWNIIEILNDVMLSLVNVGIPNQFTLNVEQEILNKLTKQSIIPAKNLRLRNVIGQGKQESHTQMKRFQRNYSYAS